MTGVKPDFNTSTQVITIPDLEGVEYLVNGRPVEGEVKIERTTVVHRRAKRGYQLAKGAETVFKFEVPKKEKSADVKVDKVVVDDNKVDEAADPVVVTSPGNTSENPAQGSPRFSNTRQP